jgi:phospholipid transport system substrate-binding protein
MKKIITFLFLIITICSTSVFAFEKKAETFVLETTKSAKSIILDSGLNENQKKTKLEKLALDAVDVSGLARYTLGEEAKNLSEKQISEFVSTFKIFFSKNISHKLKNYSDQDVKVIGSKKISENYVLVDSKIVSTKDKQEVSVEWRVFLIDNKLIIRDLVVEGLSLARTQREEFSSIIANKGFAALIQSLKEYISKN